jgi:predicted DNA-binding protein (MmcQ/YjbR family)
MEHENKIKSAQGNEILEKVRSILEPLPEVEEIIDGFGHTTFKANGKSFCVMGETEEGTGLSFKSDLENQEFLLHLGSFFKTPYIGRHGWVSVKEGQTLDWNEIKGLLREAYLKAAPKRLVKQLNK